MSKHLFKGILKLIYSENRSVHLNMRLCAIQLLKGVSPFPFPFPFFFQNHFVFIRKICVSFFLFTFYFDMIFLHCGFVVINLVSFLLLKLPSFFFLHVHIFQRVRMEFWQNAIPNRSLNRIKNSSCSMTKGKCQYFI